MPRGNGFEALLVSLELLRDCSDWFGPLKSAAGGLLVVLRTLQKHSDNAESIKQLGNRIETLARIIAMHRNRNDAGLDNSLWVLTEFIENLKAELEAHSQRSTFAKIGLSSHLAQILASSSNKLNDVIRDINFQALLILDQNIVHLKSDGPISRLRCSDAWYNANTVPQRRPCTTGTRVTILERLNQWAQDEHTSQILALVGRAGYGKTCVAYSFCQDLEEHGRLGASFFCSRAVEATTRVSNIIPSICYDFGILEPQVSATIRRVLLENPDVALKSFQEQLYRLMIPVCGTLSGVPGLRVVVVEGLDECSDDDSVSSLIRHLSDIKLPFKLLFTARPEQRIRKLIRSLRIPVIDLHEPGTPAVSKDIAEFVSQRLVDIAEGRSDFDDSLPWPSSSDVHKLTELASGMFLVASAACDYIGGVGGSITARLQEVFDVGLASTQVVERLDRIYSDTLRNAFALLTTRERLIAKRLLAAIAYLFDSLSIASLGKLLDIAEGARSYLSPFHSILRIGSGNDPLVAIGHDAFREFLSDQSRSSEYWLEKAACHEDMFMFCLKLICNRREEFGRTLAVENLPELTAAERYVCLHWASHLLITGQLREASLTLLDLFTQDSLLLWLAYMSHLRKLVYVQRILEEAERWAASRAWAQDLVPYFVDARRFTLAHMNGLADCTREAFFDALRWSPTKSILRVNHPVPLPAILSGLSEDWGPCETSVSTGSFLTSLASSPDGQMVALGCYDGAIQILDPRSLQASRSVQGHDESVRSLEFSHDGSSLLSASDDTTVRVWDTISLDSVETYGHPDSVSCALFALYSTAVVTSSADAVIRWWDRSSGSIQKTFRGHEGCVNIIRITSNDSLIVSGSHDATVRVWNTSTTADVKVLRGHLRPVTSLLLLNDGSALSSSDDGTVRLWNIVSGELTRILFDTSSQVFSPITCISLSPTGTHLAVGASDLIYILKWSVAQTRCEKTFRCHAGHIVAVLFLPDSHRVLSASSSKTLQSWDLRLSSTELYAAKHSAAVNSLSFSPDGSMLASTSDDCTVRVWRCGTGECAATYEQVSHARFAAFSGDSSTVVSESYDHKIRAWNVESGKLVVDLQGNSSPQWSVGVSSDGSLAASGSQDGWIQIYETKDGSKRFSLKAHTQGINTVAFSPDGLSLVSGSYDCTVKIWSTVDGALTQRLYGHTGWVRATLFTHSARSVVSGSSDRSVRVWNLFEGQHDALWGHTGGVNSVAVSQEETFIVSGGEDRDVIVWDFCTKSILRRLTTQVTAINSVCLSPDGIYVAAVSTSMEIALWHTESWNPIMAGGVPGTSHLWSVAFSPDGKYIAAGGEDGLVRLWSTDTFTLNRTLAIGGGKSSPVWKLAFSRFGVLTSHNDGVVRVWNIHDGSFATLPGSLLPDGSQIQDGGIKETVRVVSPRGVLDEAEYTEMYSLSSDGCSIVDADGAVRCGIADAYRDYTVSKWYGSTLALGYESGLVVIIKCN